MKAYTMCFSHRVGQNNFHSIEPHHRVGRIKFDPLYGVVTCIKWLAMWNKDPG